MLITSEHTTLVFKDGSTQKIFPGKEFEPINKEFISTAFMRVTDLESGSIIDVNPGVDMKGLGEEPKPVVKKKATRAKKAD